MQIWKKKIGETNESWCGFGDEKEDDMSLKDLLEASVGGKLRVVGFESTKEEKKAKDDAYDVNAAKTPAQLEADGVVYRFFKAVAQKKVSEVVK